MQTAQFCNKIADNDRIAGVVVVAPREIRELKYIMEAGISVPVIAVVPTLDASDGKAS